MPLPDDKIVTFTNLQWLVDNEGFYKRVGYLLSGNKCVIKEELIESLHVADINPLAGFYTDNQLVPRDAFQQRGTAWIGDEENWECVQVGGGSNDPPTAPELDFVSKTHNTITVEWWEFPGTDDVGIVGYIIEVWYDDGGPVPLKTVDVGLVTSYTIINLVPEAGYYIVVRAYDVEPLSSPNSDVLQIITNAAPVNLMGQLNFIDTSTSSVTLKWDDPKQVVEGTTVSFYKVEYRLGVGSWTIVTTNISALARTYEVTGLSSGLDYEFRVRFYTSGSVYSDYSNSVIATTVASIPKNCGDTITGTGSSISQLYEITMTGGGVYFDVFLDPGGIPDRFRILSGGDTLFDTGYIGQSFGNGNDYRQELLDSGIDPLTLNLDFVTGLGQFGYAQQGMGLLASKIIGGKVLLIVDAPLTAYNTGWSAVIDCTYGLP